MNKLDILEKVIEGLMRRYLVRVPDVGRIHKYMIAEGLISRSEDIENDHIAFRTMGVQNLGIQSLEKIFLHLGYERRDSYNFKGKKLDAFWYSPPDPKFPRIFISELRVSDLPQETADIIYKYTSEVTSDPVDSIDLNNPDEIDNFLHSPLWKLPTLKDYEDLLSVSEYASWVIYNRYYLNHYTISVYNLPQGYNTIEDFNIFLEKNGIRLNTAGGKAKKSNDGLLIQSSTVSEQIKADFSDGHGGFVEKMIAGSYVEFAERKVLPEFINIPPDNISREHRREGFEEGNADKIFESTYTEQIKG